MRARPLALSLVVHAGLLALVGLARRHGRVTEPPPIEIELVAAAAGEADPPRVEPAPEPEPEPEPETERAARATRGGRRPPGGARSAAPQAARGGATGETAGEGLGLGWSLGALGAGGADGNGHGAAGRAAAAPRARVARRPASKARPPRLVYPKRFRDERDGEVFVAILTIDEDGWVVGVRLVQGVDPFADQKAADAVWRFHYEPALDDAGHPVRARVEQRFMVD